MSPTLHPGVGDASVENAGLEGGGGSLAPKGLLRGRRFSPRGQICPGRVQRGLERAPTHDGQDFGGRGAHARTPLRSPPCSKAASSSIASTPTPPIQLGTGSKGLAAPSPGWILPYRARTEPWGCPGSSLPLSGQILLCFFWRKSPASACRKERYHWGPRAQPSGFRGSPWGEQPPGGQVTGGGGAPAVQDPQGRHRLRLRREMGFGISGGVRGVPHREHPCLFFFFCPLLPRPVGPVEGAPGQQHVPD